jgi:hypothetical protein
MNQHNRESLREQCAGSFASITDATLRDTAALLAWRAANLGLPPTERDQLFVVAAAERALEKGSNPAALFVSIVKDARRELITCEQDDRAARRLRAYRDQRIGCATYSRDLAGKLSRSKQENDRG